MLKRYLITGLLVWVPLAITLWVISLVIGTLDQLVPTGITSSDLFGRHVPGFGVLVVLAVVLLTGILATNWMGGVLQILLLIMGVFVYLPFIKAIDNQYLKDEQLAAEQALNEPEEDDIDLDDLSFDDL